MKNTRDLFYRRWVCDVVAYGARCNPVDPHRPPDWGCGYRWVTDPMSDETAAEYGLVHVDPKLEALAQALWSYYGDADDSWEGVDQNERDEYIYDARQLFDEIQEAMK